MIINLFDFFFDDDNKNPLFSFFDYISSNINVNKKEKKGILFLKEFSKLYNLKFNKKEITGTINNINIKCRYNISEYTLKYELIINPSTEIYYGLSYKNRVITGDIRLDNKLNVFASYKEKAFIKLNHEIRKKLYDINNVNQLIIFDKSIMFNDIVKDGFLDKDNLLKILNISEQLLQNKDNEEAIINNIKNDPNEIYKQKNIQLLLKSKNNHLYLNLLNKYLNYENPDISIPVSTLFGEEGTNNIVNIIKTNSAKILSLNTLEYIKKLDNKKIIKTICEKLSNFNKDILVDIIKYICMNNDKWIKDYLFKFIKEHPFYSKSRIIIKNILYYFKTNNIKKGLNWTLEMLKHDETDVIINALNTLEKIGVISCVEKIHNICNNHFDAYIKRKAKETISILQKDIPDEHRGGLMIIEKKDEGNLSLSEETGKLSINKNNKKPV